MGFAGPAKHGIGLCDRRVLIDPLAKVFGTMSHTCYEGACASNPKQHRFPTIRGLRTHQNRSHRGDPEEETSLGNARALKRKRDAEMEEVRKRQCLEAQLALEAANREPEPRLV